jgi:hypothetical protein
MELRPRHLCQPRCTLTVWPSFYVYLEHILEKSPDALKNTFAGMQIARQHVRSLLHGVCRAGRPKTGTHDRRPVKWSGGPSPTPCIESMPAGSSTLYHFLLCTLPLRSDHAFFNHFPHLLDYLDCNHGVVRLSPFQKWCSDFKGSKGRLQRGDKPVDHPHPGHMIRLYTTFTSPHL